ncbi:hypothetical protein K504DRAFT_492268 [Pleomassaria siparia CBS 279.74]|uniref:FHA domain-containing protein n=1 Tax=Pleomassaria siparia CBS 279.74 TaxID=1314801 RepID=A0A6G1K3Z5_9PLEO|nr:hypothetical protein K504DRAFT_492268 [Pleomassaria siparia CBS 279.74]
MSHDPERVCTLPYTPCGGRSQPGDIIEEPFVLRREKSEGDLGGSMCSAVDVRCDRQIVSRTDDECGEDWYLLDYHSSRFHLRTLDAAGETTIVKAGQIVPGTPMKAASRFSSMELDTTTLEPRHAVLFAVKTSAVTTPTAVWLRDRHPNSHGPRGLDDSVNGPSLASLKNGQNQCSCFS